MKQLSDVLLKASENEATPISLVKTSEFDAWFDGLSESNKAWVTRQSFKAKLGQFVWLESDGAAEVWVGWDGKVNPFHFTVKTIITFRQRHWQMAECG